MCMQAQLVVCQQQAIMLCVGGGSGLQQQGQPLKSGTWNRTGRQCTEVPITNGEAEE